jgi:glycerate 2-kinase
MELTGYAHDLFLRTIASLDVASILRSEVTCEGGALTIAGNRYQLRDFDHICLVAVGKAAVPMTDALLDVLSSIPGGILLNGIVVSGTAAASHRPELGQRPELLYFTGGHPFPDAQSRTAAEAVVELLETADEETLVIFLVSGGASAMLELPLDPAITVEETTEFYRALVHSGMPISSMNTLRKHLSAVKGGRLAAVARRATQCTLLVSDVPSGELDVIGSGPSMPDPSTADDCRRLARENGFAASLPARVRSMLLSDDLPETEKSSAEYFARARFACLLSSDDMLRHAGDFARGDGYFVETDLSCDDWEYERAADHLLGRVTELQQVHPRVCLLSGGELSVRLEGAIGTGGRNGQFALACARRLAGSSGRISVLSAGSDGLDGNSPAAGAVVDSATWQNALEAGLDPDAAHRNFNSFPLFDKIGAAVVTGPTGNNLRDLRILIAEP